MGTLFDAFKFNRDNHPDATAFLIASGDRSVPIKWSRFAEDISAVAWVIKKYANGGTIGLIGENSYEWITAHAACVFSGATVVPVEVTLSASEIADRLRFTGAAALIYSSLYSDKAKEVKRLMPGLVIGGFGSKRTDFFIEKALHALRNGAPSVFDEPQPDDTRTSMIVFTSGTTSKPHGAEITMKGMATFAEYAQRQLRIKKGDRSLMVLPLHHIFGICAAYLLLSNCVALGVCPDFRRLYDTVERFRANYLFLVPALAEILAEKIAQRGASAEEALGSPLDWILVGGAPMARRIYENLRSLGVRVLDAYGLTETTSLYSISSIDDDPRIGSAGKVCTLPGVETKVGEDGILYIKGPNVLKGYYRDPEHTAKVLSPDGWFRTGDVGRIDEDGYAWIVGRASRTIVLSSGKKIAPEELEGKILQLPGILEAVVSGDGESREVKAEIYASVQEATVRREINDLNSRLPVYKRIKTVVIRNEPFPRTASGKICFHAKSNAQSPVGLGGTDMPATAGARQTEVVVKRQKRSALFGFSVALVVSAIAVATLGVVPLILRHYGVECPSSLRRFFDFIDLAGEILLGLFAILIVFRLKECGK